MWVREIEREGKLMKAREHSIFSNDLTKRRWGERAFLIVNV